MLKSHNKTIHDILGRHAIHPFPARMSAGIALGALDARRKKLRVLDPMSGSGTVLAVANAKGHEAIGFDLDPLAVLLATVWTRPVDSEQVNAAAFRVLRRAQERFNETSAGKAYPRGADAETEAFVRYWFDPYARRQLASLAFAIAQERRRHVRDVLWCGFSRLIIAKSAGASLAMDLSHSRPHRTFKRAPIKPFNKFLSAVHVVVANCPPQEHDKLGMRTTVARGDARRLKIAAGSIDLVLTSPPYLNGIDYLRCSKFSLVWMGHTLAALRKIRGNSVGAEAAFERASKSKWVGSVIAALKLKPALSSRTQGILARYAWDMERALAQVSRVLRRGGRAVYVVGDSTNKGTYIRNSAIVMAAAKHHGLKMDFFKSRPLPRNRRYLPPPKRKSSAQLDARLRREVVVGFRKP